MKNIINPTLPPRVQNIGWFEILSRYEIYLTNNLYRAIRELKLLQLERENIK